MRWGAGDGIYDVSWRRINGGAGRDWGMLATAPLPKRLAVFGLASSVIMILIGSPIVMEIAPATAMIGISIGHIILAFFTWLLVGVPTLLVVRRLGYRLVRAGSNVKSIEVSLDLDSDSAAPPIR